MITNRKDHTMNAISRFAIGAVLALSAASASFAAELPANMSEGEITKIDKDAGKLTIRHGELKNLGMPPMTMVFRAKNPAMIEQAPVGTKIKFVAEKVGGSLTVVQLETVK
jgi:Cu(I)/Ag(I) efflux system protein CusF